jgi:anti-sigma B factor antagonist
MRQEADSKQPVGTGLANGYSLSRTARNGDGVVLAVSGEIDISNAEAFSDQVSSLYGAEDGKLTLDLERCLFIDSTGIRALMVLARERQTRGQMLRLSGVSGEPQRVLKLSGLLDSDLFASEGLGHSEEAT